MEVGPPISLGGDIAASGAKAAGKTLGKPQPYASGLNATFRFAGDLAGSPSLKGTLVGIGDKATPALAVTGAFTGSYNATIMVECGCGVIK